MRHERIVYLKRDVLKDPQKRPTKETCWIKSDQQIAVLEGGQGIAPENCHMSKDSCINQKRTVYIKRDSQKRPTKCQKRPTNVKRDLCQSFSGTIVPEGRHAVAPEIVIHIG